LQVKTYITVEAWHMISTCMDIFLTVQVLDRFYNIPQNEHTYLLK
jgi:hypothetical protein